MKKTSFYNLVLSSCAMLALSAAGRAQIIDHSNPSAGNDDLTANQSYAWGPMFLGGVCRLTDKGSSETASIFSREKVNVSQFENSFVFQILNGGPGDASDGEGNSADGITFTIQAQGSDAMGAAGGSLGYEGITKSFCVKFDTVPNNNDPSVSSTGIYGGGEGPFGGYDLMQEGIKLRSQHPFRVDMTYDGAVLQVRITDLVTNAFSRQRYNVDIPKIVGSRLAYVGFTGATGLGTSAQDILKWYYASPTLTGRNQFGAAPSASGSRVAGASVPRGVTVAAWPTAVKPRLKEPMRLTARFVSAAVNGG
jgi:hypothetical protein